MSRRQKTRRRHLPTRRNLLAIRQEMARMQVMARRQKTRRRHLLKRRNMQAMARRQKLLRGM